MAQQTNTSTRHKTRPDSTQLAPVETGQLMALQQDAHVALRQALHERGQANKWRMLYTRLFDRYLQEVSQRERLQIAVESVVKQLAIVHSESKHAMDDFILKNRQALAELGQGADEVRFVGNVSDNGRGTES